MLWPPFILTMFLIRTATAARFTTGQMHLAGGAPTFWPWLKQPLKTASILYGSHVTLATGEDGEPAFRSLMKYTFRHSARSSGGWRCRARRRVRPWQNEPQ